MYNYFCKIVFSDTKTGGIKMAKKILALVLSIMLIASLGVMSVSATEEEVGNADTETGYYCEVALFMKESYDEWSFGDADPGEWSIPQSESVYVTSDGRYVVEITDLVIPIDNLCLCYIKDVDAEYNGLKRSNLPEDVQIITEKIVLNDSRTVTPEENVRTGLKKGAVFDICYENDWTPDDCTVDFSKVTEINSIRVTFTVSGLGGTYVDMDPQPEEEDTVDVGTAVDNTVEEAEKDGCVGGAVYLPLAAIVAAAALVVFKKRG